ncbi:MAG: cysteine desulfurase family protein [Lachnospiraceae bacterium]|nr:cysteine desulfurase family protein [Lachnospiraceae bacterium]
MSEIYFDNSSTTKPSKAVLEVVEKTMTEDYGNPSSMHKKGMDAEAYLKNARRAIADTLKADPSEIYFTSGGTESNNWALIGTALANQRQGRKILTTQMEHPAVAEPCAFLEKLGFEVGKIPVDENGTLDLETLEKMLTDDVILVSTMYVNNEIGAVVPVEKVAKMVHSACPHAFYHVDAIQAYGKYRIRPARVGIDMLSVSGHKLHGPKGTGFLYVKNGVKMNPLIYGGGQNGGMRSGTENVPGIAGLGIAAREAYTDFDAKIDHLYDLKEHMIKGLMSIDDVVVHGMPGREGAPHIVNASFLGVGSEVLLHTLESHDIYVSAGSACSTHKRSGSPTLTAIHAPQEEMASSVRFSFCENNTVEEVDETIRVLREELPRLRRYRAH